MKLYLCPGHKTSLDWSKPIRWRAFLFNVKIVYTARWRLFATPDTPWLYVCHSMICWILNFEAWILHNICFLFLLTEKGNFLSVKQKKCWPVCNVRKFFKIQNLVNQQINGWHTYNICIISSEFHSTLTYLIDLHARLLSAKFVS